MVIKARIGTLKVTPAIAVKIVKAAVVVKMV